MYKLFVTVTTVSSSDNITFIFIVNILTTLTFIYILLLKLLTEHELTAYDARLFHKLIIL